MSARILVAEDEEQIAAALRKGFTKNGFDVEVAGDGVAALEMLDGGGFDLLILDMGLPRADGEEVLRTLRRRGDTLPVLILTARDAVRDKVGALEEGADDYVTKPFSFHELLARVRARLRVPVAARKAPEVPSAEVTCRVLMVGDDPRVAAFLARDLEASGVHVVVAPDGEVGLFLVRTEQYDAVLVDLDPDRVDLAGAVARLRSGPSEIAVIVLGDDDAQRTDALHAAGATAVIAKPFRTSTVRAAITTAVNLR